MLNLLNTYKNQRSWLEQVKRSYSWQFAVKRESALVGFLIKSSRLLLGKMSRSWVLAILSFSRDCIRLRRLSGSKGLALYLKTCSVLLMKYCARQELKDLSPLKSRVSRTKSGIPRIVVPYHRECIRKNDRTVIRLWMTLFGLYRVIEFKGVFSVKTITSPFRGKESRDTTYLIDWFVKNLQVKRLRGWSVLPLVRSGPLTQQGKKKGPHKGMVMSPGNVVPKWIGRQTSISVCAIQAYAIVNEFPWILGAMD